MPMTVTTAISMFYVILWVNNKVTTLFLFVHSTTVDHFFKQNTINE